MSYNLFDFLLLLLLDARLTLYMVDEQIGRIIQYGLILVWQHQMWTGRLHGIILLIVPLIVKRFDLIEETLGAQGLHVVGLEIDCLMIERFQIIFLVLFPPMFVEALREENENVSISMWGQNFTLPTFWASRHSSSLTFSRLSTIGTATEGFFFMP